MKGLKKYLFVALLVCQPTFAFLGWLLPVGAGAVVFTFIVTGADVSLEVVTSPNTAQAPEWRPPHPKEACRGLPGALELKAEHCPQIAVCLAYCLVYRQTYGWNEISCPYEYFKDQPPDSTIQADCREAQGLCRYDQSTDAYTMFNRLVCRNLER